MPDLMKGHDAMRRAWEFVDTEAASGNGNCLDCPYSKPDSPGHIHTCEAKHPTDCWVLPIELECELDIPNHDTDGKGQ